MNADDTLFVVFDNVVCDSFEYSSFLKRCKDVCVLLTVELIYTSYYCFEELFLSCEILSVLLNDDMIKNIRNSINSNNDYINDLQIRNFLKEKNLDHLNREKISNIILSKYTQTLKGDFQITKLKDLFITIGKCWIQNCDDIQSNWNNQYKVDKLCTNCEFKQYCRDKENKFKILIDTSILRYNDWLHKQMYKNENYNIDKLSAF